MATKSSRKKTRNGDHVKQAQLHYNYYVTKVKELNSKIIYRRFLLKCVDEDPNLSLIEAGEKLVERVMECYCDIYYHTIGPNPTSRTRAENLYYKMVNFHKDEIYEDIMKNIEQVLEEVDEELKEERKMIAKKLSKFRPPIVVERSEAQLANTITSDSVI